MYSSTASSAIAGMKVFSRWSWRWHSDKGTEFTGEFDKVLRDLCIIRSDTGGYDSAANGLAEA
eukprot:6571753-Alexandrium_andersonii.AAC.1